MKQIYTFSIIIAGFLFSPAVWGQSDNYQAKDSLRKVIAATEGDVKMKAYLQLTNMYFTDSSKDTLNCDTLFVLYDEMQIAAEQCGNLKYAAISLLNKIKMYRSRSMTDKLISATKECIDYCLKNELWEYYYDACQLSIRNYREQGEYEKALELTKEIYDDAKKRNNEHGISSTLLSMATIYRELNRFEDQEKCLRQSIEILKKSDLWTQVTTGYFYLCQNLSFQKRHREAIAELAEYEKAILRSEEYTYTRNGIAWNNYWSIAADVCFYANEYEKAELFCKKLEESGSSNFRDKIAVYNIRFLISEKRKDYKKALEYLDLKKEINNDLVAIWPLRLQRARIIAKMGRVDEADSIYMAAFAAKDSTFRIEINAKIDELHVQYEMDKHIAEKEKTRNYFLFALAGCLLLAIALGIWIYLNRKIAGKNRTLAQQIRELTAQQELREAELLKKTTFVQGPEEEPETDDDGMLCPESRMDKLCIAIRDIILKEKAYRNPAFSRDYVIERLGTSRKLFVYAFYSCFSMPFTEYINSLRLKDAVRLLEQSDLSIEDISEKTGFGTLRTFQRQFQKNYNLSPKDYRDSANK